VVDEEQRSVEEISIHELRAAARAIPADDQVLEVARVFGLRRISAQARARIEHAVQTMHA
jgi:hypothetical protein